MVRLEVPQKANNATTETLQALEAFIQTQRTLLARTQSDIDRLRSLKSDVLHDPEDFLSHFDEKQLASPSFSISSLNPTITLTHALHSSQIHWSAFTNRDPSPLTHLPSHKSKHPARPNTLQTLVHQARRRIIDPLHRLYPTPPSPPPPDPSPSPEEKRRRREHDKIRELKARCVARGSALRVGPGRGGEDEVVLVDVDDVDMDDPPLPIIQGRRTLRLSSSTTPAQGKIPSEALQHDDELDDQPAPRVVQMDMDTDISTETTLRPSTSTSTSTYTSPTTTTRRQTRTQRRVSSNNNNNRPTTRPSPSSDVIDAEDNTITLPPPPPPASRRTRTTRRASGGPSPHSVHGHTHAYPYGGKAPAHLHLHSHHHGGKSVEALGIVSSGLRRDEDWVMQDDDDIEDDNEDEDGDGDVHEGMMRCEDGGGEGEHDGDDDDDFKSTPHHAPPSSRTKRHHRDPPPSSSSSSSTTKPTSKSKPTSTTKPPKPPKPKPATYNLPWTSSEQHLLETLLASIPPTEKFRWQKISRAMGGRRTPRQVASRVQKFFEKMRRFGVGV